MNFLFPDDVDAPSASSRTNRLNRETNIPPPPNHPHVHAPEWGVPGGQRSIQQAPRLPSASASPELRKFKDRSRTDGVFALVFSLPVLPALASFLCMSLVALIRLHRVLQVRLQRYMGQEQCTTASKD